nr:hypothetical protein [Tanacetum cinerariifolium]
EDSNELFQKLLKDLKELAEYDQSTSTDRPIFLNDNEDHPVQNKESPENSSEENVVLKTNQEPPQDSNIHQLIEECSIEVPEEQKQNMEKTMLDLVKLCHHKQFLRIHNEQEVKIVEEQPTERRNRIEKSLQNFRVIQKSSISLNTSQIYLIHEVAPILSTKEPENSLIYDDDFEDIEYVEASLLDPEIVSIEEENGVEEENVVQREEEEVDLEDISQVQYIVLVQLL